MEEIAWKNLIQASSYHSLIDSKTQKANDIRISLPKIPSSDPCISAGEPAGTYPPYDDGDKLDIWVKNASGDPLLAKVWPEDYCHFPDFFKTVTEVNNWVVAMLMLDFVSDISIDELRKHNCNT